jgi:ABC-type antimicrobial peptide transport system permease subunit
MSDVQRLDAVRSSYDASVPAWSLQLGVLAAVAGLLLAALVLVLIVASTWRRRTRDLACLGMTGVPRRGLRRTAIGEQLPAALLAVLAGAGCGVLGAALALPTVPLFASARPPSTVDLSAPWPVVLAVLAVALVGLGAVTVLCGLVVAAAGDRLARVRETL